MLKATSYLSIAFGLFFTQATPLCFAMEDLRRDVLNTNAHCRLYTKMNTVLRNEQPIEILTKDEQYLLLKRLDDEMKNENFLRLKQRAQKNARELSDNDKKILEKYQTWQSFFEQLKTFVTPEVLYRALPPEYPSPETTPPPTSPPRPETPGSWVPEVEEPEQQRTLFPSQQSNPFIKS